MADFDKIIAALSDTLGKSNSSRLMEPNLKGIERLQAFIANNPGVQHDDIVNAAIKMGYRPDALLDAATGDMMFTNSRANISSDFEDIANTIFEKNPTPGSRVIIDPAQALKRKLTPEARKMLQYLYNRRRNDYNKGVAVSQEGLPIHTIIKNPKNKEIAKLKAIADIGHEFKHQTQTLTLPDFVETSEAPYTKGHHAGEIYESDKLIKDVRGISDDSKEFKAAAKASKKLGGSVQPFRKLMSLIGKIGPIGAGIGAISALRSGDVPAAVLHGAAAIDPTGISDAALDINNRLKMNPEDAAQASKEDYYSAMPDDLANEQRMLDELKEPPKRFTKLKERLK